MSENQNLRLLVEGMGYLATIIVTLGAMYGMRLRARQNELALSKGADPKSLPDIGVKPLLLFAVGGALLAYLFAQNPRMAQRVLPTADSAELSAVASPVVKHTSSERSPLSPEKPRPSQKKPRLVADVGSGTLCAGCEPVPWMEPEAPTLALR